MTLEERQFVNRDPDGVAYTVDRPGGVESAWNSPFMKGIRLEMLNGSRPAICRRCFADEDLGIRSYRHKFNQSFHSHLAEALHRTTPDRASPPDLIRSIDLQLGNVCNLRCRMCSPISSKLLFREFAELMDIPENDERFARLGRLDWFSREETWRMFESLLPHIDRLHLAGASHC